MKKLITFFALFTITLHALPQTSIAHAQAMYIYNFCRLIEWPTTYSSVPFVIGVLGNSPIYTELKDFMSGNQVGAQPIMVEKFDSPEEISKCQILFVPYGKSKHLAAINAKIGNYSTLVITEKGGSLDSGSSINFAIIGDKLKFEMMPSNAREKQIKISTKLNNMAFKVH